MTGRISILLLMLLVFLTGGMAFSQPVRIQPVPQSQTPPSPLSIDSKTEPPPEYIKYTPYNDGYLELDLWRIEERKFFRSRPVLSPDKREMAYSEVTYMPNHRQTFTRLFLVRLPEPETTSTPTDRDLVAMPLTKKEQKEREKAEKKAKKRQKDDPVAEEEKAREVVDKRYNPNLYLKTRQELLEIGADKSVGFSFETLTVVDWSASGDRLLFKRKSGILYVGLKTTDILVYDRIKGAVTIYPEIQRALDYYWEGAGGMTNLPNLAWDIVPLGWLRQSDSIVVFKGWAYEKPVNDKPGKKFLGTWHYNIEAERAELISLEDQVVPVAANGLLAEPDPKSADSGKKKKKKK